MIIRKPAYNVKILRAYMIGRRDCILPITYSCAKEIRLMDYYDYLDLQENLRERKIELEVVVR